VRQRCEAGVDPRQPRAIGGKATVRRSAAGRAEPGALAAPLQPRGTMPVKRTIRRGREDERRGKAPSTKAGEFVREEIEHIREGKHGAKSPKQATAIGLSKARRAGVKLPAPRAGTTSKRTRRKAEQDVATGNGRRKPRAPSRARSRATSRALKREGRSAASTPALSRRAKQAAAHRRRRGTTTARGRKRTGGRRRAAAS
jgi:hypothetical protein